MTNVMNTTIRFTGYLSIVQYSLNDSTFLSLQSYMNTTPVERILLQMTKEGANILITIKEHPDKETILSEYHIDSKYVLGTHKEIGLIVQYLHLHIGRYAEILVNRGYPDHTFATIKIIEPYPIECHQPRIFKQENGGILPYEI